MTISELRAKVAEQTSVINSAVELLRGLKAKLDEAIATGDPAALQALSDEIGANTTTLSTAVVENTPAPPPAPPA